MNLVDPHQRQLSRTLWGARTIAVVITLAFLALLGRVGQLMWQTDPELQAHAGTRASADQLLTRRGAILDRNGRTLAVSRVGYRLFVDPALIDDDTEFAFTLARAIGDDPARIEQLIGQRPDSRYIVIDRLLADEQVAAVKALESRAIGIEPRLVRSYPLREIAGQLVGFVGEEHRGLDGAEFLFESELAGENGRVAYLRDARRRPVWIESTGYTPPTYGNDIALSIDAMIQAITEHHLAAAAEKYKAQAAEAIVMHARTGQILAMANWPFFDPNQGGNVDVALRRNRCITDPYEPGSIFKPFVHAALTAAGFAKPTEKIDCTTSGFYVTSGRRRLRDAHGHGTITWDQVLIQSSNIGMAIVAQRMGAAKLHAAVTAFGFGQPTGSALPGESRGIVNPLRQWNHYSVTSVPMGQEIAVTPLQMVRAFAAFANSGLIPTPSILAAYQDRPIYQQAIDPDTADRTRQVLARVVAEGTGRKARSDKYRIWGKTGTAQVPDRVNGGYIDNAYTASFVCGAPLRRPQIVVIVVVHRPDKSIGHYGGTVAAPAAKLIVEQTLEYLGTPHDADDSDD